MFDLILAVALSGQCVCEPTYVYAPIYVAYEPLEPLEEYWFGAWQKRTEFRADVFYGEKLVNVPVVNGFVPDLKRRGNTKIYDYRRETPLTACKTPFSGMKAPVAAPAPAPQPKAITTKPSDVGIPNREIKPTYRSNLLD